MASTFNKFATMLEETYGVFYDREEGFVICPECDEPIYDDDWDATDYMEVGKDEKVTYYCPCCEEVL